MLHRGGAIWLAILNERDDVAIDIAHMKIDAAPGLPDEPLSELYAAPFVLFKECLDVLDLYRRQD